MLLRHGADPDLVVDGSENLRDVIAANIDNFDFAAYADKVREEDHSDWECRGVRSCILNVSGEEDADKAEAVQLRRERRPQRPQENRFLLQVQGRGPHQLERQQRRHDIAAGVH